MFPLVLNYWVPCAPSCSTQLLTSLEKLLILLPRLRVTRGAGLLLLLLLNSPIWLQDKARAIQVKTVVDANNPAKISKYRRGIKGSSWLDCKCLHVFPLHSCTHRLALALKKSMLLTNTAGHNNRRRWCIPSDNHDTFDDKSRMSTWSPCTCYVRRFGYIQCKRNLCHLMHIYRKCCYTVESTCFDFTELHFSVGDDWTVKMSWKTAGMRMILSILLSKEKDKKHS